MSGPNAVPGFLRRGLPGALACLWLVAQMTPSAPAIAATTASPGIEILASFAAADEKLRAIFKGVSATGDIGGRAHMFARSGSTRYAMVSFPVRATVKPERIGEPYCRNRLLTPERDMFESNLSRRISDDLVARHIRQAWVAAGRISGAKVMTSELPGDLVGDGYAVSICFVADSGVSSAPSTVSNDDVTGARIAVADAIFDADDFANAAPRYRALFSEMGETDMLMKEVISLLKAGDLDAGFARDELLQEQLDRITDTALLERYEDTMDAAIKAYMSPSP